MMNRLWALSGAAILSACAATAANTPASSASDVMCHADKAQYAVGKTYTVELGAEVQTASGAKAMRAIRPGEAVTMDFRQDRLNLELDAQDKIIRASCG